MTDTTAAFYGVTGYGGRRPVRGDGRRIMRGAVTGLAAVATVGLTMTAATLAAAWLVNTALTSNPRIQASAPIGPRSLALAGPLPDVAGAIVDDAPDASFETRWARALVPASASVSAMPVLAQRYREVAANVPLPPRRPVIVAQAPAATQIASVPLPRPFPVKREPAPVVAQTPPHAAPQVAMAAPPPMPAPRPPQAPRRVAALPAPDSHIALYDIAGHTVYLPNGEKLEAHSGLGDKLDDPRYVKVRMRGPTPPNTYDLTLRQASFHGVRAIRLNPVDDDKMFGRAGMLAHTYMLGANGQSNGCVSFKDYSKFLHAYLRGEVDRLVVVARLGDAPAAIAGARRGDDRYAFNNQ